MAWRHFLRPRYVSPLSIHTYLHGCAQINKQISQFLAQNRARNDASNRREFLLTLDEKRKRLFPDGSVANPPESEGGNSCARTDAKFVDRDVQMKYDVARNEEGPLRRTVKAPTHVGVKDEQNLMGKGKRKAVDGEDDVDVNAGRHPGLDERLTNIETHLSVRYGKPLPPPNPTSPKMWTRYSPLPPSLPPSQTQIPRRTFDQVGKRISTLGCVAF